MSVRIGLVGQRAEMAVEVARVAAALGAEVVRIDPEAVGWVGAADDLAAGAALAAVLVDVDGAPPAVAATGSSPGVPRIGPIGDR
jgi:CO/xanthine dehydrogenase Mo-binding subunit